MSNIGIVRDAKDIFLAKFGYFDGSFVGERGKKVLYPKREAFDSKHLTDHGVAVPYGLNAIYPTVKGARVFSEMPKGWLLSWSARDMSIKYFTDLSCCICTKKYKKHVIAILKYIEQGLLYDKLKAARPDEAESPVWAMLSENYEIIEKGLGKGDVVDFDDSLFGQLQPLNELYLDDIKKSIILG